MKPDDSNAKENLDRSTEPLEVSENSSPAFITTPSSDSSKKINEPVDIQTVDIETPEKTEGVEKIEKVQFEYKEKVEESSSDSSNAMNEAIDHIKQNKESWATYIFLLAGLLFLVLGDFFLGSLILGLTAGFHFSHEIVFYLRNLNHIFEGHEHLRFLVLTAVIIGFFLSIPGIFIGAIAAAVFKHVIYDSRG